MLEVTGGDVVEGWSNNFIISIIKPGISILAKDQQVNIRNLQALLIKKFPDPGLKSVPASFSTA